jgi:hypothetical protein
MMAKKFTITHPMHSSCGVLLVTGFGAEAYAEHFDMRLPTAREWIYITLTGNNSSDEILQLPVPVMDYEPDDNGLRGIGEMAEWSRTKDGGLVVMDPEMAGNTDSEARRQMIRKATIRTRVFVLQKAQGISLKIAICAMKVGARQHRARTRVHVKF